MKLFPHDWFRHDPTAHTDERMLKLFAKHGYGGWGVFWHAIEALYLNNGSMEADVLRTLCDRNANAFDFAVRIGLLVQKDGVIHSERLMEEIALRMKKSKKASESAREMWRQKAKKMSHANAERTLSGRRANAMLREERRGEEKRREDSPPTSIPPVDAQATILEPIDELALVATESLGSVKTATREALDKYRARLRTFPHAKLAEAFRNLRNEPDLWKIRNNGHRSLAWWLHSDERIRDMLGCHLKKSGAKVAIIPRIDL